MGLIWLIVILALGALGYFAIKGRMIRLREEFQEALRRAKQGPRSTLPSQDMVKCPTCSTYIAPNQQKNCGKPGCPYK